MSPSRSKISAFLRRLRLAIRQELVFVEVYALDRATEDFEWDRFAIVDELKWLELDDFHKTDVAKDPRYTGEMIWVFCPEVDLPPRFDTRKLWIRLIERKGFIVISFHEA